MIPVVGIAEISLDSMSTTDDIGGLYILRAFLDTELTDLYAPQEICHRLGPSDSPVEKFPQLTLFPE